MNACLFKVCEMRCFEFHTPGSLNLYLYFYIQHPYFYITIFKKSVNSREEKKVKHLT